MNRIRFLPFYCLSVLPFPLLYALSDITFLLLYYVFRYRRKVVNTNLTHAFPNRNQKEIKKLEKQFYAHFCDLTYETFKALTISKKSIHNRFKITNAELLENFYRQNRSVILYTAHDGNWEWLAFLPLFISHKATTLYKPLSNTYYNDLIQIIRSRFGVQCIESDKGYKTLLKLDAENILTVNYIVGDQSPGGNSAIHWVFFLNQETAFLTGADRIAKKTNEPLVFPSFKKIKRGYYELTFVIIDAFPQQSSNLEIIEKFAHILEEKLQASPHMWLWSHKRWKKSKATSKTPL